MAVHSVVHSAVQMVAHSAAMLAGASAGCSVVQKEPRWAGRLAYWKAAQTVDSTVVDLAQRKVVKMADRLVAQ
jgi:hypothetical protein